MKIPYTGDPESLSVSSKSTNTINIRKIEARKREKAKSHVLPVVCHLSCVTCQLSLTATASATVVSLALFPTMHSRVVCKDQKHIFLLNAKNKSHCWVLRQNAFLMPNIIDTTFNQETLFPGYDRHSYRRILQLKDWISQWANSSKKSSLSFGCSNQG